MRNGRTILFVEMLIGFGIGWFFFRKKEEKTTKVIAGISGAILLPIILYFTVGRISMWSPPKPISLNNFLATYGLSDHWDDTIEAPAGGKPLEIIQP